MIATIVLSAIVVVCLAGMLAARFLFRKPQAPALPTLTIHDDLTGDHITARLQDQTFIFPRVGTHRENVKQIEEFAAANGYQVPENRYARTP